MTKVKLQKKEQNSQCEGVGRKPLQITQVANRYQSVENSRGAGSFAKGKCPVCKEIVRLTKKSVTGKHIDKDLTQEVYTFTIDESTYAMIFTVAAEQGVSAENWVETLIKSSLIRANRKTRSYLK